MGMLTVAVGWLIIKGVGIWAFTSPSLGICHRQFRVVDRHCHAGTPDLRDLIFAESEVAHLYQPLCGSDDALRRGLRWHFPR